MTFELPKLKYDYNALEPHIDAKTMETHHSKHHAGYVNKLNAALESHPEIEDQGIVSLLNSLHSLPSDVIEAVKNNGGGHYNHALFWEIMTPKQEIVEPANHLASDISNIFGSFANFQTEFKTAALSRFGSGWAWLAVDSDGKLYISSNANQENPVMDGCTPILGIDVWEHAYYLKYLNKRAEYVDNWWNVVDWNVVEEKYNAAKNS